MQVVPCFSRAKKVRCRELVYQITGDVHIIGKEVKSP